MRVLFVSDVYFPRVNGVSTSIRTFRADLAQLGRRNHAGGAGISRRRRQTRARASSACPRAACRAIPKTGAFWAARCSACSMRELAAQGRPGAHPHAVHRALRRVRVSRARTACPWSRPTTPSSRTTCITTCRSCRAASAACIARRFTLLAVRRRRRADFAQRADARRAAGLRRAHAHRSAAHRPAGREFRARRRRAFPQAVRSAGRPAAAAVRGPRGLSKRTSISCCACSCACARAGPMRCS